MASIHKELSSIIPLLCHFEHYNFILGGDHLLEGGGDHEYAADAEHIF